MTRCARATDSRACTHHRARRGSAVFLFLFFFLFLFLFLFFIFFLFLFLFLFLFYRHSTPVTATVTETDWWQVTWESRLPATSPPPLPCQTQEKTTLQQHLNSEHKLRNTTFNKDMFVLFCDAWNPGSVCDALSMMVSSSMTALQAPGSYRRKARNRQKQLLIRDTPQDASTPVNGTLSYRRTPTSVGPSPTCWLSKQKQYSPIDPQ